MAGIAETRGIVEVGGRNIRTGLDLGGFHAQAEEYAVNLGERHAKALAGACRHQVVVTAHVNVGPGVAEVNVVGAGNAVLREVGVGGADDHGLVELRQTQVQAQVVARAERVFLLDAEGAGDLFVAGKTDTSGDAAGRLFDHGETHVDLIGCARHFLGIDVDFLEIAEAVDPITRQLDAVAVVPRGFELAELAPHHLVAGAGVANHVDLAHIGTARGIGAQQEADLVGGAIYRGRGLDAGKGKTESTEVVGKCLGGLRHQFRVVGLTDLDLDQRLEVRFLAQVVTLKQHRGDCKAVAFADVDRDGDVFLVRRNSDLRGIDFEVDIAARQVVGAQRFQVGVQLGARIAVGLGVPGQPVASTQLHLLAQIGLAEGLAADDVDFLDARGQTFGDVEAEVDAVARHRRDRGHNLGGVQAAVDVLALELLLGLVGQGLVKGAAFGQADVAQGLGQCVLVELLGADEIDGGNGRAFFNDHHQHVAVDFQAHVLEQAQREQRADRRRALLVVVGVAHAQRHGRKYGPGLDALQTLDADVLHGKGIHGPGRRGRKRGGQHDRQRRRAKALEFCFHVFELRRPDRGGTALRQTVLAKKPGHIVKHGDGHHDQQDRHAGALQAFQPCI